MRLNEIFLDEDKKRIAEIVSTLIRKPIYENDVHLIEPTILSFNITDTTLPNGNLKTHFDGGAGFLYYGKIIVKTTHEGGLYIGNDEVRKLDVGTTELECVFNDVRISVNASAEADIFFEGWKVQFTEPIQNNSLELEYAPSS